MTERFPPDCSSVSGRFRNTTFICFGPSAASLALRAHSRGLRPPVLVLRLLRWRSALTPGVCAPLFWSFDCFASLRASGHLARLLRCAARSRPGGALSGSFGCSAVAPRLGLPRSTTPLLRCVTCSRSRSAGFAARLAVPSGSFGCPLRCAPRVTSLDCSPTLRARRRAVALPGSFDCSAILQRARACEISQATGLCYAGGRSGARFFLPAPSISDLSVKELASA